MYHIIYQTINMINNKIYIGKESTSILNSKYLGSGKCLKRAVDKYGKENFKKEILFIFELEDDAIIKEREIVNQEFIARKDTYNITCGGHGSWYHMKGKTPTLGMKHTMETKEKMRMRRKGRKLSEEAIKKIRESLIGKVGRKCTKENKIKMSKLHSGNKNPMYGDRRIWIHNGNQEKFVKKEALSDYLEKDWIKGRSPKVGQKTGSKLLGKIGKNIGKVVVHKNNETKYICKEELAGYLQKGWTKGHKYRERNSFGQFQKHSNWLSPDLEKQALEELS